MEASKEEELKTFALLRYVGGLRVASPICQRREVGLHLGYVSEAVELYVLK